MTILATHDRISAKPTPDLGSVWCVHDISVNTDTDAGETNFQLAVVMWDLNHKLVYNTLANDRVNHRSVEDIDIKYRLRDNVLTDAQIKQIFDNHGNNTAGWI